MTELTDDMAQTIELTRMRILHALEIFPFMSSSQLHQAIGTSTPGSLWKPLLQHLLEEGKIVRKDISAETVTGRCQAYTIYHLPCYEYPPIKKSA